MNVKKVIAREWLYIVGFAAFAAVFALMSHLVFTPQRVEPVSAVSGPKNKSDYTSIRQNLDSIDYRLFQLLDSQMSAKISAIDYLQGKSTQKDWLEAAKKRDSLYEVARVNWTIRRADWVAYSGKMNSIEGLFYAALILPYLLFWFIRSLLWSYRQIRKRS